MQIKKQINAFTLSEMVVVLIISSIVVGLAFSVLNLVQKHMSSIQSNFEKRTKLNNLEEVLTIDFNRFSEIEYNPKFNELKFKNPVDSLSYYFEENYINRLQDTFNLGLIEKQFFNYGVEINSGNVDAIKLSVSKGDQKSNRFVFKINAASNIINNGI